MIQLCTIMYVSSAEDHIIPIFLSMTYDNIQTQLDLYRFKYDNEAKAKLIDSMSLEEKERFFTLLILEKYEHLFVNTVDFETI